VSRTATAPVDRLKLLLQVHDTSRALTIRDGFSRMASEGVPICVAVCPPTTIHNRPLACGCSAVHNLPCPQMPAWQMPEPPASRRRAPLAHKLAEQLPLLVS
jgi:hypothetical protein